MIFMNNFSPVIVSLGALDLRWYGVMFAVGVVLGYLVILWAFKREKYEVKHLDSLAIWLFVGIVVGARLGHIFFYNAGYFLNDPVEILKIWEGGLSSHGATIGVFLAYALWCRVHKVAFAKYTDLVILGVPLIAACVRIGNFFNSEIVGKATGGDFGVIFAKLGEDFPRHPAQLYEAVLNILIFAVLFVVYKKNYKNLPPMLLMFMYLFLYFGGRFVLEFWKDLQGPLESFPLTMGQTLSMIPMFAAVVYFIFVLPRQKKRS